MRIIGEHAVVVGGSMGGLLAARVLSEAYERVTVIDRDELADRAAPRKGVPQGRHGHGLHPSGLRVIEALFPGITQQMVTSGAVLMRSTGLRGVMGGHALVRADMGHPLLSSSRPFLEHHVRTRVSALPAVRFVDRCDVLGLVGTPDDARVNGVRVLRGRDGSAEEKIAADLVVDATGRSARGLNWLAELGYPRPDEEELHVGVVYATRHVRLPAGALGSDRIVVVGPQPGRLTGMYLAQVEDDWWMLTVFGYQGSEPARDPDCFAACVRAIAPPDLHPVLDRAEPLTDVVLHRLPSSLRRRYDRLERFPGGFLVIGDAVCSLNPIYGQGMAVAALQAEALRAELGRGRLDARRFFRRASRPIGDAWDLATGADLSLPEVPGPRSRRTRLLSAYVDRVQRVAEHDVAVSRQFLRVIGLLDRPSSLLRPGVLLRVMT